jgi:hypothetical protein
MLLALLLIRAASLAAFQLEGSECPWTGPFFIEVIELKSCRYTSVTFRDWVARKFRLDQTIVG